jgi:molybdate transport system regulatory protein
MVTSQAPFGAAPGRCYDSGPPRRVRRKEWDGQTMSDVRLTVRVDFGAGSAIGPGKIRLLETIGATGSISQAGRALEMSYRRAWLLVDDMNRCFRTPVVTTQGGGTKGGGATLTPFGRALIAHYRAIEAQAMEAADAQLRALKTALRRRAGSTPKRPMKTSIRAATTRGDNGRGSSQRRGATKP